MNTLQDFHNRTERQEGTELTLDSLFGEAATSIVKDLKLNLLRVTSAGGALSPEESYLTVLACAESVEIPALAALARKELEKLGVREEVIREAIEIPAIMGMLNTYYRFRHMIQKEGEYGPAGLRMTSLSNPQMGKEKFEMLSLAISILNGCEKCIRSHEGVLVDAGVSIAKIHDLARISSIVKGVKGLKW